jgi:2-(3-amino-3-carboxypropyl)histidine synthase
MHWKDERKGIKNGREIMDNFTINLKKLKNLIEQKRAKKIYLQLPEGLITRAVRFVDEIEAMGVQVILSAERCFGACDLRPTEAAMLGCDLIVHVGHKKFYRPTTDFPVLYFEWPIDVELNAEKLKTELAKLCEQRVGLLSSVQYSHLLPRIAKILEELGKKTHILGEVLGCTKDICTKGTETIDALLFVGSGTFHPTGINHGQLYFFDLERMELRRILNAEKRRWAQIARASEAHIFGILISSKPGQFDPETALDVKRKLEERNKKACLLIMDEITNDKLERLGFDAYVNTACPRLVENVFNKPIINAEDVEKIFEVFHGSESS